VVNFENLSNNMIFFSKKLDPFLHSVHLETECHSNKLSQHSLLGGRLVWVELARGRFVGGQIFKASICYV
jgi:hypothetical protein